MNAYRLEVAWATRDRTGMTFVYAEGTCLADAMNRTAKNFGKQGMAVRAWGDSFAHAECDTLQPIKNGVL